MTVSTVAGNKPFTEILSEAKKEAERRQQRQTLHHPESGWHVQTGEALQAKLSVESRAEHCWASHLPVLEEAASVLSQRIALAAYKKWKARIASPNISEQAKESFTHQMATLPTIPKYTDWYERSGGPNDHRGDCAWVLDPNIHRATSHWPPLNGRFHGMNGRIPIDAKKVFEGFWNRYTLLFEAQRKEFSKKTAAEISNLSVEYMEKRLQALITSNLLKKLATCSLPKDCLSVTIDRCRTLTSRRTRWISTVSIRLPGPSAQFREFAGPEEKVVINIPTQRRSNSEKGVSV